MKNGVCSTPEKIKQMEFKWVFNKKKVRVVYVEISGKNHGKFV